MNIIYQFLKYSGIKEITKTYADKLYYSHPKANTLLGLKQLLAFYGVESRGFRCMEKETIELDYPNILHWGNQFVIGLKRTDKNFSYLKDDEVVNTTWKEFCNDWDGIVLLADDASQAQEPGYEMHAYIEKWEKMKWKSLIGIPLVLTAVIAIFRFLSIFYPDYYFLNLLLDFIGLGICTLLIKKKLNEQSNLGDRLCSLFGKHSTCNSVLESDASSIFGISWAEIGTGYFIWHMLIFSILPQMCMAIHLIGWIAMLFSIWSIWYQWKVVKSWCFLCLQVQMVIWVTGIVNLFTAHNWEQLISMEQFISLCITGLLLIGIILFVHFVLSSKKSIIDLKQKLAVTQSMSRQKEVFRALLYQQTEIPYQNSDINIRKGWADAPTERTLVIFTSPEVCAHCRAQKKQEEKLLKKYGNQFAIHYINLDLKTEEERQEIMNRLNLKAAPVVMLSQHIIPKGFTLEDVLASM